MLQRDRYLALMRERPDLFVNPPDAPITIVLDEEGMRAVETHMAERLAAKGLPREWAQVGIAHEDQYLMLLRDAVRFPDGSPGTYIRTVAPAGGAPGVIVLPVYEGNVLLLRHFRHGPRSWLLECPRGFGEPGFSSAENARRELGEEIAGVVQRLVPLGPLHIDGGGGQVDELFYAELDDYGAHDQMEGIAEVMAVPMAELDRMIAEAEITDGYTLAAYARAKARGLL